MEGRISSSSDDETKFLLVMKIDKLVLYYICMLDDRKKAFNDEDIRV
jgi:hypothetical protein